MKLFRFYFVVLFFFILACSKKNKKNPYTVSIKPNETIQKLTPADLLDGFAVRFNSNYNPMESFSMEIDFFDAEAKCSPREGELDFSMNAANAYTVTISCDNLPQKSKGFLEMRLLSGGKKFLASAKMAYALDEIWTLNDFEMIPTIGLNKNYKQMQNIDGKGQERIRSIQKFSGEYNGNDKFFENVTISATTEDKNHFGLFNEIEGTGTIMNWRLKNINLSRSGNRNEYYSGILTGKNNGKIYLVSVTESELNDNISKALGAIAGENDGEIYFTSSKNNRFFGGNGSKNSYFVGKNNGKIEAVYAKNKSEKGRTFYGIVTERIPDTIKKAYYKEESEEKICIQKDFEGEIENCNDQIIIRDKKNELIIFNSTEDPKDFPYNENVNHTKYKEIIQKAGKKPSTSAKVFKQDGTLFWE